MQPTKDLCSKNKVVILFILFTFFYTSSIFAQQPMPPTSGFSGYIEVMGGYISTNSQLSTNDDNSRIESLYDSGKRSNEFRIFPLGLIKYTFAAIHTQLFLGVLPENISQGQFMVEAGGRHELWDGTLLSASFIPLTPFQGEVWKDPFVVGQDREKTEVSSYGFKVGADNIMASGVNLRYEFASQDLDDDHSGQFLASQPDTYLTSDALNSLQRDADFHRITLEYTLRFSPKLIIKPGIRYIRGDADGDAYSYNALRPEVTMTWIGDPLMFSLNTYYRGELYDNDHPVYGKERKDHSYGALAILSYRKPFGLENVRIDWFNIIGQTDSNIDFYESTNFVSSLGLAYTF